jgi:uncharacterized SAM-binding protein YcdF (DUF218 family)
VISATLARRSPRWRSGWWWATAGACLLALLAFARTVHPFLAVHAPVPADTLVIEGWLPEYAMAQTVAEIRRGGYERVIIAGMAPEGERPPSATGIRDYLTASGIPPERIDVVIVPATRWNRTSSTARAVRDRLTELHAIPRGVNIVTLGPHARQSLLAYSRMLGPSVPTGAINLPKAEYDPARWWASIAGVQKTLAHLAGWIREFAFGLRS